MISSDRHLGSTLTHSPTHPHTHTAAPAAQSINASAEILEAVNARVDLASVLGINAFSLEKVLELEPGFLEVSCQPRQQPPPPPPPGPAQAAGALAAGSAPPLPHSIRTPGPIRAPPRPEPCRDPLPQDGEHQHDSSVTSVGIQAKGQLSFERVNAWLSGLMQEKGADIFRSKGVLCIKGSPDK